MPTIPKVARNMQKYLSQNPRNIRILLKALFTISALALISDNTTEGLSLIVIFCLLAWLKRLKYAKEEK
jgi:hypothetical protein